MFGEPSGTVGSSSVHSAADVRRMEGWRMERGPCGPFFLFHSGPAARGRGEGGVDRSLGNMRPPSHSLPPHLLRLCWISICCSATRFSGGFVSHLEAAAIPRKCTNKMQKYEIRQLPALAGRLRAGGRGAHQGHVGPNDSRKGNTQLAPKSRISC